MTAEDPRWTGHIQHTVGTPASADSESKQLPTEMPRVAAAISKAFLRLSISGTPTNVFLREVNGKTHLGFPPFRGVWWRRS